MDQSDSPVRRKLRQIAPPPHVSVKKDAGRLRIRFRWIWARFTGAARMCLLWNGFVAFAYWGILRSDGPEKWLGVLFTLPHVAVGLLLIYATLAGLLNRTVVEVTSEFITVRVGPVPWWGNSSVRIDELERLQATRNQDPETQQWTSEFVVRALTRGASQVDLVRDLDHDQAQFIANELERYLDLHDHGAGREVRS
jgi:hypothetical protein